jgi:type IV pilus assembly protein PilC
VPDYWYSALTGSGAVQEGWLSAPSETAVEDRLRETGAFLIRAELRHKAEPVRRLTDGKVERRELLAFLDYLAGSFDVGIPILEILDDVATRITSKRLRTIIGEIRYAVSEEGKSLSAALAEHPLAFPELYVGTIRAGEASGELGFALRQLVDYMDWQESISSQLKQATMYPIIVLGAVSVLVLGLIGFVFPRILPMLTAQKVKLPLPTRVVMALSSFVRNDWLTGVLVLNGVLLAGYFVYRTRLGRRFIDSAILRIPVIGHVIRDVNMARIVTYLSLFYRTGVELVFSLQLVERITSNSVVSDAVGRARESVTQGISIASAFGQSSLFPTILVRSLALGEATGNLDQALSRAKDYYSREIPAAVRRMITVLQPLLVAIIGGVILTVALAIMLPILNIYNTIGKR